MYPPRKDQQLRWNVSPLGSKLDFLKHVLNLSWSFHSIQGISAFLNIHVSLAITALRSVASNHDWAERVKSRLFVCRKILRVGFKAPSDALLPDCYRHLHLNPL